MAPIEALEVPYRDPDTCILAQLVAQNGEEAFNMATKERRWQWARPQVEGAGPCARGGHTATLVHMRKSSAKIFIFGGHYDSGSTGDGFIFLNDTFVLDIDENTWQQPRLRGTCPEARYGHSAALVGSRIVYFGGKGKGTAFRDLHALDTNSLTWYQGPSSGGTPSARHGHTATLQGTRLFLLGGVCGTKYYGDLHCLDLSSMAWSAPTTQGPKLSPRYGHTALLIGDSLLVHGGFCMDTAELAASDNSGNLLKACYKDDVRVLDLSRMIWSRLRTHGTPPTGRFGHTMVLSEDDAIMFGGWNGSQKEAAALAFTLKEKTRKPEGDKKTSQVEETVEHCMTLRTTDMTWSRNKFTGVPASKRYGHTTTTIGPHLIIFGGWDGGKPLNDVVVLRDSSAGDNAENPYDEPPSHPYQHDEDEF